VELEALMTCPGKMGKRNPYRTGVSGLPVGWIPLDPETGACGVN